MNKMTSQQLVQFAAMFDILVPTVFKYSARGVSSTTKPTKPDYIQVIIPRLLAMKNGTSTGASSSTATGASSSSGHIEGYSHNDEEFDEASSLFEEARKMYRGEKARNVGLTAKIAILDGKIKNLETTNAEMKKMIEKYEAAEEEDEEEEEEEEEASILTKTILNIIIIKTSSNNNITNHNIFFHWQLTQHLGNSVQ
jgi:hypothetical protein